MRLDRPFLSLLVKLKFYESEQSQHDDLIRYNQAVIGMHQYYNMATMINADVHRLFPSIDITMKTRLNSRADLSKERPPTLKGAMDEYFYQKYGESKQVRYILVNDSEVGIFIRTTLAWWIKIYALHILKRKGHL